MALIEHKESVTINGQFLRNHSTVAYADVTETGTIPAASPYTLESAERVAPDAVVTATINGGAAEIVPWGYTLQSGEIALDREQGLWRFAADDAGLAVSVTYAPAGTVVTAAKMELLGQGEQGEPGVGVPAGGTTGQALVKLSNDDFDTGWGAGGAGADGEDGRSGPGRYTYKENGAIGAANGEVSFDSGILSLGEDDADGASVAGWLLEIGDSTNTSKGYFSLLEVGGTDKVLYEVTSGSALGVGGLNNYVYFSVTLLSGTPVVDAVYDVNFSATGDKGADGAGAWGSITGTLSSQTDLQAALDGKSSTSHNHNIVNLADVTVTSIADGHVLAYDSVSGKFKNVAPSGGGGGGLADPGANGIVVRTASGTTTARTITGTTGEITVTNGNGVSGNPTLAVGSNIPKLNASANIFTGSEMRLQNAAGTGMSIGKQEDARAIFYWAVSPSDEFGIVTYSYFAPIQISASVVRIQKDNPSGSIVLNSKTQVSGRMSVGIGSVPTSGAYIQTVSLDIAGPDDSGTVTIASGTTSVTQAVTGLGFYETVLVSYKSNDYGGGALWVIVNSGSFTVKCTNPPSTGAEINWRVIH